jgi:hypothetical protein
MVLGLVMASSIAAGNGAPAGGLAGEPDTTQPPPGVEPTQPVYIEGPAHSHAPVIRVYKDTNAWFGENRDNASLLSLGKTPGDDYFIHPIVACQSGIPAGTAVVFFSSNGFGLASSTAAQNHPACQSSLQAFVQGGGVLIVDMGDNHAAGGYRAPGATGTPSLVFPVPAHDATLAPAAVGPDGIVGTADDHPIVKGPDGTPGTADDLNNTNIDACCFVAHGNLSQGITLPSDATILMTAMFQGVARPILAEYCLQGGLVILDTITKEFIAHQPPGVGPTTFMRSLFHYGLNPETQARCALGADKEVTDVVLDDASGYPDSEGRPLQQVSRDSSTRTTTYRMRVELLTNPFISVVSLEQNNGPQDTESTITFLASIDDGHAPGHVGGAFIPDAGSPRGQNPDLLTCHSRFDPENPLDQTLVPCPHKEKVPGDGIRSTAESDLHFEMRQEARSEERILRFFKLHCLVVGQHTITFYNKVEPIAPTEDPDLSNNWWRAILEIDCVIRSTPGKVTGGGYIDPLTGALVGEATLNIVDGILAGVGDRANFGFVIELKPDETVPSGNLLYYDHAADVRIKSTSYDALGIVCPHATFTGMADVNGVSKKYQVDVDDINEPGSSPGIGPDTFTIRVLDGSYMATGPLVGGNIQIHTPECG